MYVLYIKDDTFEPFNKQGIKLDAHNKIRKAVIKRTSKWLTRDSFFTFGMSVVGVAVGARLLCSMFKSKIIQSSSSSSSSSIGKYKSTEAQAALNSALLF